MSARVRAWCLHRRTMITFTDLARLVNPVVRGWMNYYGRFYRTELYQLLGRINAYLVRWIRNKYKRLRARRPAQKTMLGIQKRHPRLFAHWAWVASVPAVW
jgi:hypothetical protein